MTRASESRLTLLRDGDEHLRRGRGTQADACFREILEHQPDDTVALHRRGVIAFLRGDPGAAIGLLRRAISTCDDDPTLCAHLANALAACGQLDEAISYWQRALESAPDYAAAHLSLGDAYFARGDIEASETSYRKSIALAPDDPRGFVGLGRILHFSNRDREAEATLQRALEVGDGAPEVCNQVGTVLLEAGGAEAALTLFESAARERPDEPQGHAGRGLALHWLARPEEAEDAYRRALEIDPDYPLALKHLGVLLQESDQLDAAAECFKKLLLANPDDDVARHMLAATTGAITPSAPAGYVTRLFDDYADRFDAHLGTIDYQVPERIRDALVEVAGNDKLAWRILDLGCGTGQCGEAVRPLAAFLAGADLSPRMIAKARERDVYDSLTVASIDDALAGQEQCYDAIIAGDTFIYVGDLSSVIAASACALRAHGLMAFSVESTDGDTYRLCPTGRYAHSGAYIDATAGASGMCVAYRRDVIIRVDPVPIQGQIVVLSKAI